LLAFSIQPARFGVAKQKTVIKQRLKYPFISIFQLTDSIGKGVASLSLDPDYVRKREKSGRERPKHFGEGIALGAKVSIVLH